MLNFYENKRAACSQYNASSIINETSTTVLALAFRNMLQTCFALHMGKASARKMQTHMTLAMMSCGFQKDKSGALWRKSLKWIVLMFLNIILICQDNGCMNARFAHIFLFKKNLIIALIGHY